MDNDEKIRANLVGASSIVILSWWLDLPLARLLSAFGADLDIDPYRLSIAGLLVLSYLLLRYRYSSDFENFIIELPQEKAAMRLRMIDRAVTIASSAFNKHGKMPAWCLNNLDKLYSDAEHVDAEESYEGYKRQIALKDYDAGATMWNRSYGHTTGFWVRPGGQRSIEPLGTVNIEIRGRRRVAIVISEWLRVLFYSKASIRTLIPLLLASIAAFILMCRAIASHA